MSNRSVLIGWQGRLNKTLLRFLGRRVPSRVDIEDLAQETYLRLLRAPNLTEVRNPQAYLLRVARHVLLEWRGNQPMPESLVDADAEQLIDECLPEFELDAHLSQRRLDETLASVSPLMRAVLLLRLRDDRSVKDVAKDLGISVRQVRRYLARGYQKLHVALGE